MDEESSDFSERMLFHTDMTDMQTNLAKLRALSEDDKTENAMLRSRINDQSQLIMILKQRADEATLSLNTLEKTNRELVEFRENAEEEFHRQLKKYDILDARFMELASNHEEMIQIKDEYKSRNSQLMKENAALKEDNARLFSQAIEDRNAKISNLEKDLAKVRSQCADLENRNKDALKKMHEMEASHKKEVEDLQAKIEEIRKELSDASKKLQEQISAQENGEKSTQMKLERVTKEKDELLELAMSRGKIIQDKQMENKKLQEKIGQMEKNVREMQEKFDRDAVAVDVNLQVRKLRAELADVNKNYESSLQEYAAYRKHSQSLLEKEKELNARLRHFMP